MHAERPAVWRHAFSFLSGVSTRPYHTVCPTPIPVACHPFVLRAAHTDLVRPLLFGSATFLAFRSFDDLLLRLSSVDLMPRLGLNSIHSTIERRQQNRMRDQRMVEQDTERREAAWKALNTPRSRTDTPRTMSGKSEVAVVVTPRQDPSAPRVAGSVQPKENQSVKIARNKKRTSQTRRTRILPTLLAVAGRSKFVRTMTVVR